MLALYMFFHDILSQYSHIHNYHFSLNKHHYFDNNQLDKFQVFRIVYLYNRCLNNHTLVYLYSWYIVHHVNNNLVGIIFSFHIVPLQNSLDMYNVVYDLDQGNMYHHSYSNSMDILQFHIVVLYILDSNHM
uniref:Uncharacterized protein n=1 Tax=Schistosoma curassoni TaxID=6186 RepID=A0A183JYW6_9TREM